MWLKEKNSVKIDCVCSEDKVDFVSKQNGNFDQDSSVVYMCVSLVSFI